jgi:hypothetical protein
MAMSLSGSVFAAILWQGVDIKFYHALMYRALEIMHFSCVLLCVCVFNGDILGSLFYTSRVHCEDVMMIELQLINSCHVLVFISSCLTHEL